MSSFGDPESKAQAYSRKEKSLGLLCVNFLCLYSREQVESVSLDEAASRLGVERRRIYDIVNVLESVGVLVRKAKNRYTWKGYDGIPKALERLREAALNGDPNNGVKTKRGAVSEINGNNVRDCLASDDDEEEEHSTNENCNPNNANLQGKRTLNKSSPVSVLLESSNNSPAKSKADSRREKSLGLLTQKFVQLFLVTQAQVVSLEDAARLLLGECKESAKLKTKVRRLYDIANVLSSLNLIEKTHSAENRKPAFKWLGIKENPTFPAEVVTRKRQFGTVLSPNAVANAAPKSKRGRPPAKEERFESPRRSSKCSSLKPLQPRCTNKGGAVYNPVPSYPREGSSMPMPDMAVSTARAPTTLTLGSCGGWREWTTTDSHKTETANRDASNNRLPPTPPAFTFGPFCPVRIQQQCIAGSPSADPSNSNVHSERERSTRGAEGMPPVSLHYQNEALAHMVAHFMDAWKSWYLQVSTPATQAQVPVSESVEQPCDSTTEAT